MLPQDVIRNRREFIRAIQNKHYEVDVSKGGIEFPRQKLYIGGHFETWLNGKDHRVHPNIIPVEGLNQFLKSTVTNGGVVTTWHMALFSGNVTPNSALTGATFDSACTEFTDYDEGARVVYVPGTVAAGAVDNAASRAMFTINNAGTVYGAGLLQASAWESVTGPCLCAARFSPTRVVADNDELAAKYALSATST